MIKANRLARAVAHWTGFESACDRESLLSESSLAIPVGQCLKALPRPAVVPAGSNAEFEVVPEVPYVTLNGDADFVLQLRERPNTLLDVIEMKMVRATGRNYSQEIFNDLIRLESVSNATTAEPPSRWLLIAGTWEDIQKKALDARGNEGDGSGRVKLFASILQRQVSTSQSPSRLTVDVKNSSGAMRRFWGKAQRSQGLKTLPSEFLIDLRAMFPPDPNPNHYTCLIWRILRSNTREAIDLHSEEPPPDVETDATTLTETED